MPCHQDNKVCFIRREGRGFCNSTIERVLVNGAFVGGGTGLVRALSAAVRGLQSGYLRYYAALLLVGLTSLSLYFLVSA